MTAFTDEARDAGQARIAAMLELAGASPDIRAWFPAGFEAGAKWALVRLFGQEPTDAEVEAAARAMFDTVSGGLDWDGEHNDEATRERFRNMARAALSAARAARLAEELPDPASRAWPTAH